MLHCSNSTVKKGGKGPKSAQIGRSAVAVKMLTKQRKVIKSRVLHAASTKMNMASNTGPDSASRFPVIRADAIDPGSPFTAARMRPSIPSRIASMAVAKPSLHPSAAGAGSTSILPNASPVAPMRWK